MIVRNGTYPKGKDMGPAQLFSPAVDMNFLMGPGSTGRGRRLTITRKVVSSNGGVSPSLDSRTFQRQCKGCPTVFTTENIRRVYCSQSCIDKAYKARHTTPRVPRALPSKRCIEHPDRAMLAKGLCHPCYQRQWRRKVKAA